MDRREQEPADLSNPPVEDNPQGNLEVESLVDYVLQETVESGQVDPSVATSFRPVLTRVLTQCRFEAYSGPLPPKEYEKICPGIINRHVTMMEEEGRARRSCAKIEAWGGLFGLLASTIITLAVIGGGFFLIYKGYPTKGFIAILVQVGILAGIFVYGKKQTE